LAPLSRTPKSSTASINPTPPTAVQAKASVRMCVVIDAHRNRQHGEAEHRPQHLHRHHVALVAVPLRDQTADAR
jgi:hypothetical protein